MKRSSAPAAPAADVPPPRRVKKVRLADRTGVNTAPIAGAGAGKCSQPHAEGARAPCDPAADATANSAAPAVPARGRDWTVTVALPGSICDNAQTQELRSYLVGQVARACAIFNVDEIVVFSTESGPAGGGGGGYHRRERREREYRGGERGDYAEGGGGGGGERSERPSQSDGCVFMARLLQYIECPQYLRKHIFPHHPDLRCVGILAPLDAPHHLRIDEAGEYREAVVVEPGSVNQGRGAAMPTGVDGGGGAAATSGAAPGGTSSSVYTGLRKELRIGRQLPTGTRVTVRMPDAGAVNGRLAAVVPPREPREAAGLYWGYEVRLAKSLSAVWSECPHAGGYDVSLGTSEHGSTALHSTSAGGAVAFEMPTFRHLLIVFGGVEGLEPAVAAEDGLADCDDDVPSLFDHYLNLCPNQGSRTIRTEEALLVGLAALKPCIERVTKARGASS